MAHVMVGHMHGRSHVSTPHAHHASHIMLWADSRTHILHLLYHLHQADCNSFFWGMQGIHGQLLRQSLPGIQAGAHALDVSVVPVGVREAAFLEAVGCFAAFIAKPEVCVSKRCVSAVAWCLDVIILGCSTAPFRARFVI